MASVAKPTRRNVLTGHYSELYISSAVVSVLPAHRDSVIQLLSKMTGVEVHHQAPSKIVIVLEASESGALGARLIEIASLPGVLSANMVFEHTERLPAPGEST